MKFTGNKILITGGSSDIGISLGKKAFEKGLDPVLTFRNEKGRTKIEESLKDIEFKTLLCDYKSPEGIEEVVKLTRIDYFADLVHGNLEAVVSNLDYGKTASYYHENVVVRALLLKEVSRIMMKNKFGRLLYISSLAAEKPNHGQGFYASSKLACETLYKSCGYELGKKGITSVVLRPGYVDAGRARKFIEMNREKILKQIPARKILSADELAESILFFLSDSALGFNATSITLDGGFSYGKIV